MEKENVLAMHKLKHNEPELAQAFVTTQPFKSVYSPDEGLCKGTVFPNLSQPYIGWQKRKICE